MSKPSRPPGSVPCTVSGCHRAATHAAQVTFTLAGETRVAELPFDVCDEHQERVARLRLDWFATGPSRVLVERSEPFESLAP